MKVYIGPYKNWIGPFQIAQKILFWMDREDDRVYKFGEWLAGKKDDSLLTRVCLWFEGFRKQKISVRIDKYDTWSMDHTLAHIILPMLKQLKETKHGSPIVDLEDVPESMRTTSTEDYDSQLTFDFYNDEELCKQNVQCDLHQRWSWVLDEMIFAFECKLKDDWDEEFWSGEWGKSEFVETGEEHFNELTNKMEKLYTMTNTGDRTCDWEAREKVQKRINNGFRLFGKYYEGLWD